MGGNPVIKHPFAGLRLAAATAAVVGLLAVSVGPVAADTTPGGDASYSQNGSTAEMYASSCTDNGVDTLTCVEQDIGVFSGKMTDSVSGVTHSSQVCASVATYTVDAITGDYLGEPVYEYGCRVDLASGVIRFGSKLSSASLAATHVTLEQWVCDDEKECVPGASRDVVVAATWTGFGPINTGKYRSSGNDGTCRYSDWFKGSDRSATAIATFDGLPVSGDQYAYLSSGRNGFKSACTEV
jgi:hypothetical protein